MTTKTVFLAAMAAGSIVTCAITTVSAAPAKGPPTVIYYSNDPIPVALVTNVYRFQCGKSHAEITFGYKDYDRLATIAVNGAAVKIEPQFLASLPNGRAEAVVAESSACTGLAHPIVHFEWRPGGKAADAIAMQLISTGKGYILEPRP